MIMNASLGVTRSVKRASLILALAAACLAAPALAQPKTIKAVMHSDLKVLDPIWTTANIVRNHGYMVWDTLFAMDEKLTPQPQMVDAWTLSDDRLTYSFTLRDGLKWHDGKPVTAEDCIASLKRWGARDSTGLKLMSFVAGFEAVNDKTFKLVLKEPYGLVIDSLAKPGGSTPLMMPRRIAETDPGKQISEFVGSGPFIFKADEWKPGDKTVYVRNPDYVPRKEPASGLAGGKVAKVDRVEWLAIPDHQTAVNALLAGEIDYIEAPPHDLKSLLLADKSVTLKVYNLDRRAIRLPLEHGRAAVQQREDPPRRDVCLRPEGLPRGRDRRSALLPDLRRDVRLRHAARERRRHGRAGARQLRQVEGAPEGSGLRRHADRDAAHHGHRRPHQCRPDRQGPAREGRLQGRDGAARLPGDRLAPPAQDAGQRRRLERLHDRRGCRST